MDTKLLIKKSFLIEWHKAANETWRHKIEKEFPDLFKSKYKKGDWLIRKWNESGDVDFVSFKKEKNEEDFYTTIFWRFGGDWKFEDISKDANGVNYIDSRNEFDFRLATFEEITHYKKMAKLCLGMKKR